MILLAGCAPAKEATKTPIKIGLVLPLTGPAAALGNIYLEGAQLAIDDLNAARILDRSVLLVVEDTGSEPKNAVTAMQKLVNVDGVKFFATISSSHGLALKPLAAQYEVVLFGDVSHPNMTGDNPFLFRHSNIADEEAKMLAQKILELGAKRVGILASADDYGFIFNKILRQILSSAEVQTQSESFDPKGVDFKTEITKVKEDADTVVVASVGPAMNLVLKQLKESEFKGTVVANIGFVITPSTTLGPLVDGVYHSDYPYTFLGNWPDFVARYKERYGKEPQPFHAISYGTIELLVNAIARAQSDEPMQVSRALHAFGTFQGTYETITLNEKGDAIIPLIVRQYRTP
jgi:branched-chain amino acid transport system substrate-binding protein